MIGPNAGSYNVAVGYRALTMTTGHQNVAIGQRALWAGMWDIQEAVAALLKALDDEVRKGDDAQLRERG